jgi:hypothetical protein
LKTRPERGLKPTASAEADPTSAGVFIGFGGAQRRGDSFERHAQADRSLTVAAQKRGAARSMTFAAQ